MAKFCPNCGEKVKEEQDVCLKCGKVLPNDKKKVVNGNADPDAKSKVVAGLLAIFIGTFGIHNFYLGYTSKAVTQLLISTLTCGIGAPIVAIWSIIEGVYILTGKINVDADGRPLVD